MQHKTSLTAYLRSTYTGISKIRALNFRLRRILDAGRVSKEYYESKVQEWTQEYKSSKAKKKPGGNYYATQAAYLGINYLKLALSSFYRGAISRDRLARYLKVKPGNVSKLEDFYFGKVG